MQDKDLITALRNAASCGDSREIIALANRLSEKDLATNPELEEAYRLALLQISD